MTGAGVEKFCLRWNDFENNISTAFRELKDDQDFFDVTLACKDDKQIQAHKVILSACSPFFKTILKKNPHQHPLLYLKGVLYEEIVSVLNFMYHGEVNVAQENLTSFLAVAEELQVKGLTENKINQSKSYTKQQPNPTKNKSVGKQAEIIKVNSIPPPPTMKPRKMSDCNYPPEMTNCGAVDIVEQIKTEAPVDIDCDPAQDISADSMHDTNEFSAHTASCNYDQTYGDQTYDDQSHGYLFEEDVDQEQSTKLEQNIYSQHARKANDGGYQCNICDKKTRDNYAMKNHLEGKHDITPGYNCPVCNLFCRTRSILEYHRKIYH